MYVFECLEWGSYFGVLHALVLVLQSLLTAHFFTILTEVEPDPHILPRDCLMAIHTKIYCGHVNKKHYTGLTHSQSTKRASQ